MKKPHIKGRSVIALAMLTRSGGGRHQNKRRKAREQQGKREARNWEE